MPKLAQSKHQAAVCEYICTHIYMSTAHCSWIKLFWAMERSSCLADAAQEGPVASDAIAPGQDDAPDCAEGQSAVPASCCPVRQHACDAVSQELPCQGGYQASHVQERSRAAQQVPGCGSRPAVGPLQQSSSPANTADTEGGDGPAQRCRMRFYFTEVKHKFNQALRKAPAGFQKQQMNSRHRKPRKCKQ